MCWASAVGGDGHGGPCGLGFSRRRKNLLLPNDTCIDGGFGEVDPISMKLLLSVKSYD